jgi:hypothetical protein
MAYMSQENKAKLAPEIKRILKKYQIKGSLSVRHHSTLVLKLKSGPVDFIGDRVRGRFPDLLSPDDPARDQYTPTSPPEHFDINPYWYKEHFKGRALAFLAEMMPAMNVGNHDRSDIQTDYFDVGWYVEIKVGDYREPYLYTGPDKWANLHAFDKSMAEVAP